MPHHRYIRKKVLFSRLLLPRPRGRFHAVLLLAMALTMGAGLARAHGIVVHTSLQDHPVTPETPATVVLRFSQRIQLPLTKMFLVNEHGEKRSLELAQGKRRDEVEVKIPALPAGRYVLRYNVLAIDGHFTEGVVRFAVAAPR